MSDQGSPSDVTNAVPSPAPDTTPAPPPAPDATTTSSSDVTDSTAPSSRATDSRQTDREGLLAVIQTVVKPKPEPSSLSSDDVEAETQDQDPTASPGDQSPQDVAPPQEAQPPEPTTPAELPDPTETDLKKLRPETRRRIEQLLAQRNEARRALEGAQPELQQFREFQGHLQRSQLTPDDANLLIGLGATLRRGDYQGFLNTALPYVLAAQEALGQRIAPDLNSQVEQGLIDEASAREMTRMRHRAAEAEARLASTNQAWTQNQQYQHQNSIKSAVDTWENGILQRDPDYPQIRGAVRRVAQGLLQERGMPRSAQEAVAMSQQAYDEARTMLGAARPAPKPTRPAPSSIRGATGNSVAEPRNLRDVVVNAILQSRRAS